MENQSRFILFIILSMLVLGISTFFMPTPPPAPNPSSQGAFATKGVVPGTSTQAASVSKISAELDKKVSLRHKASSVPVSEIRIETDNYIATFSNQGAVLTGFQLKKYLNRQTHQFTQLVNPDPNRPKPFSLRYSPLPDLNQKVFEVEGLSKKLSKSDEKAKLVFRYLDDNGTVLEKSFGFNNGSYLMDFDVTVAQTRGASVPSANLEMEWADTLGQEENTGTDSRVAGYRVATLAGGRVDSQNQKKSQENVEIPAPLSWIALANQFFVAALIPDPTSGGASAKIVRDFNAYKSPTVENPNPDVDLKLFSPRPLLVFAGQALKAGESFHRKAQVFLGPQDYVLLKNLNLQLENVVDFGMFGFISVYMLDLLKWFFSWAHNWGLAIILLSVTVKLALWWPTHNSYKNMAQTQSKMKEIQPKLESIKRKYAEDKQEQQKQTMALYQQAGINPMGGCLPMLFQMPVFFALYSTLSHSIELRGASFLWLRDLTLSDPIFVFPLLMGVTMIVQQKVSGQMATQAAGQQKFMMWFFPIFLTFISFKWPGGLLVYWVVTNLLSMLQQKVVNREIQKAKKKDEGMKS